MAALGMHGQAPPPDLGFDRELERQRAMQAYPSLFCVVVKLQKHQKEQEINRDIAVTLYNTVAEEVTKAERRKRLRLGPIRQDTGERQSTGFAVASNGVKLRILTCAHTIADIYTRQDLTKTVLTIEELNEIFMFDVHCVHHEEVIRTMVSDQIISERTRWASPAVVVALDVRRDLMVLEVNATELIHHKTADDIEIYCEELHPLIPVANVDVVKMQKLVLVGWPPQRPGASATGQVSHTDWTYDAVSGLNSKGYTMRLLEVHGMTGDDGFSGAPVLNGPDPFHCVGVYHGVHNLSMGYVITSQEVNEFLQANGMLNFEQ